MRNFLFSLVLLLLLAVISIEAADFSAGGFDFTFTPSVTGLTPIDFKAAAGYGVDRSTSAGGMAVPGSVQVMSFTVACKNNLGTVQSVIMAFSQGAAYRVADKFRGAVHIENGGILPYHVQSGSISLFSATAGSATNAYAYDDGNGSFSASTASANMICFSAIAPGATITRRLFVVVNTDDVSSATPGFVYKDTFSVNIYTKTGTGGTAVLSAPLAGPQNLQLLIPVLAPMSIKVSNPQSHTDGTMNFDNLANCVGRKFAFSLKLTGSGSTAYTLDVSSLNGGKMKHSALPNGTTQTSGLVPYDFYMGLVGGVFPSSPTSLTTTPTTLINSSFSAGSAALTGYITIPSFVEASYLSGTYTDTITFTLNGN